MVSSAHGGWARLRAGGKEAFRRTRVSQGSVVSMISCKNPKKERADKLFMYDECLSIPRT